MRILLSKRKKKIERNKRRKKKTLQTPHSKLL